VRVGISAPARRVALGLPAAERFWADPGVPGQAGDAGVAAIGQERGRRCAFLGRVRQRRVPELVQRPRAARHVPGRCLEERRGLAVGQPGAAAVRVDVTRRQLHPCPALSQEQRATRASLQQPRQQPGGAGAPDDDVGGAAFPAHLRLAVGEVQVRHVQGEDLVRPGRGLIQHPPQGFVPQRHVVTGQQPLEVSTGKSPAAVLCPPSPGQRLREVAGGPALVAAVTAERAQCIPVAVPCRRS
jgi:hypothetical protein